MAKRGKSKTFSTNFLGYGLNFSYNASTLPFNDMMHERRDYSKDQLQWDWLTMLGSSLWELGGLEGGNSIEKQRLVFEEMRSLIGQPSLETIRYLWRRFAYAGVDIAAVSGVFYYQHQDQDARGRIQKEATVVFPREVAVNPEGLSWEWIDNERDRLAKGWGLEPVAFGLSSSVYSTFEWECLQSLIPIRGGLGESWRYEDFQLLRDRRRFMVFADVDERVSDKQLLGASEQLGTPFLVANSTRGHHLLFPLIFDSVMNSGLQSKVYSQIGLVLGLGQDQRYLWHSLERGLPTLRVTSGLHRPELPVVSALVWDENIIVKV